jgi:hypothetical protein
VGASVGAVARRHPTAVEPRPDARPLERLDERDDLLGFHLVPRSPPRTDALPPYVRVPERGRNGNVGEAGDEQLQIALVALRPFMPEAQTNPKRGGEAAHASAADRAAGLQPRGGIVAPLSAVLGKLLPAVALCIEDERMDVDLPAARVAHDETGREAGIGSEVMAESEALRSRLRRLKLGAIHGDIEIRVRPRLLADERVDAQPPSTQTDTPARSRASMTSTTSSCVMRWSTMHPAVMGRSYSPAEGDDAE